VADPARCPGGPPDAVVLGTPQPGFDLAALPRLAAVAVDPFGLVPGGAAAGVRVV
jgi:hypothetical protein